MIARACSRHRRRGARRPTGRGLEQVVFVSEREGNDETGDGTEQRPFKTVPRAFKEGDVRAPFFFFSFLFSLERRADVALVRACTTLGQVHAGHSPGRDRPRALAKEYARLSAPEKERDAPHPPLTTVSVLLFIRTGSFGGGVQEAEEAVRR